MTGSIAHSLWLKQTTYSIVIVAIVAAAVASFELSSSYRHEHDRLKEFGNTLINAFSDSAAHAAFHIDNRQAETIVEGLMHYKVLDGVKISTNLGLVLAERNRGDDTTPVTLIADWLFSDVTNFQADLSVDRTEFIAGGQLATTEGFIDVGVFEIHANSAIIGETFIRAARSRIIDLAVEFLILAGALAFIFHKTITQPLADVAGQLSRINPQSMQLQSLEIPPSHARDELGLVVSRTNELLKRIGEQQVDLIHREKVAALGSMLAEFAHELNNPLAVVTAQSELLAETATDQKTRDRAQKILKPALRSANIVRKFLTLTRQRKIEKSALDVGRLVNESVEMLSYQLKNRNIDVVLDIEPGVNRIWGDVAQLGQVLINILVNSEQALSGTDGERRISIKVRPHPTNDDVIISVADNGPGIPADIRHKVFNYFFTTKPEGRGTGLGLSLCKSVIEGHDGTIVINDVAPHGTEVVIELPGTKEPELESIPRAHPGAPAAALHVLVVDDEATLVASISEVLSKYGHSATTATTAKEALDHIGAEKFDVILADVHMPEIDGMEFYQKVRSMDASLADKFIFISGDALDEKLIAFFEEEKKPHLNKPFEIGELISAVENVLFSASYNLPVDDETDGGINV